MPKKKMMVEWEDGAELSQSRKRPGDYSPLTRDGDNNLGHVVLSEVDDDENDWQTDPQPHPEPRWYINENGELVAEPRAEDVLGALMILGVIVAAQRAAPHVKRWWNDQAVPFLKKSRKRLSRDRRTCQMSVTEYFMLPESAPTESSQEVIAALDEYRARMSSAEARERFVLALVARLFSEEQLRVLRNARIEDDGAALELASAMETLTPQQLGESITLMLEANPRWPDEETLAELEGILGRSSQADGERAPVRKGRVTRTLRLPRTGE